ncbi:MAG: 3-hydroxyacyl-ACP dehydratase FabZ [Caldisericia bacterium]|nr:3-hydroxyacyl-ACP dehydratase FabZ [Caldisericia bacterium]MDD4614928.1 3-hydroxyacyl-ACP dehydratase FabZ [Caldisericia bacterium]
MNYSDILRNLPHRYPFLLVDRILEITEQSIQGQKNVSMNEPQFQGHFPENPVFPGVLIIEALAQLSGIYIAEKHSFSEDQIGLFAGVEDFSFKGIVRPGDVMILNSQLQKKKFTVFMLNVSATVEDVIVAKGTLKVILSGKGR